MIAWAKRTIKRNRYWIIFFIGAFVAGGIHGAVSPKEPVGKIDASFSSDGDSFTIVNNKDISRYCFIMANDKYTISDGDIAERYNKFKWTDFKDKDGKSYNKSLEPLKKLYIYCLKPSTREVSFTQ